MVDKKRLYYPDVFVLTTSTRMYYAFVDPDGWWVGGSSMKDFDACRNMGIFPEYVSVQYQKENWEAQVIPVDRWIQQNKDKYPHYDILKLTLSAKWFYMIWGGRKTQEYREVKSYWDRLKKNRYDLVQFTNGYRGNSAMMILPLIGRKAVVGKGKPEWGAPEEDVYILNLGERLFSTNIKEKV